MPGLPSTTSVMESPTPCTKQLISVAVSEVPAAESIRPAGMKPRSCASRNRASQWARFASGSTEASARATRARTSAAVASPPFAYFSRRTSWEMGWAGNDSRVARSLLRGSRVWAMVEERADRIEMVEERADRIEMILHF